MRRMLWLGVMALVGLGTGCRTINREITESVLERGTVGTMAGSATAAGSLYTLTNDTLTDVEFEGSVIAGDVVARYQRGLGPQAQCIADSTTDLLSQVSERTGVTILDPDHDLPASLRSAAAELQHHAGGRAQRVSAAPVRPGRRRVLRGHHRPEPQLSLSGGARAGGDFAGEPDRRAGPAGPFLGGAGPERARQQLHPLVPRRPGQLRRLRRV